jgi:hypothetical protein
LRDPSLDQLHHRYLKYVSKKKKKKIVGVHKFYVKSNEGKGRGEGRGDRREKRIGYVTKLHLQKPFAAN